ncbi:ABC transporter substrate-binding protein [Galactobacter sp.]|uniref:ABC transporter substrate-binding protein n=1 Tax=Galactobacter sp. TaxID=2676125 RepID=UPI0025BB038D|nr:extracellular solute-binding protein [Galactobacter sp.]
MKSRRNHRGAGRIAAAGLAIAGVALTSACAPGSNNKSSGSDETKKASEVETDVSKMGDITLNLWDQESRGAQDASMKELIKQFEAKYPNIKIKRNSQSFDDLNKTLPLALSGDASKVPDVVQGNNGRNILGSFVQGKQVINLDPYAEAYGWEDRFPESVLTMSTYSTDGKTFGDGSLYGLPQGGEIVGVYYNKKILEDAGVKEPQTWDEFTESLKTIKGKGKTPIMLGDAEKWPAVHVFGPVQGAYADADEVTNLALGNEGSDWTDDDNVEAAKELQGWAKDGYLNKDYLGTKDQPVAERFAKGEGAYMIAGSWNNEIIEASKNKDDYGFFAPPAEDADEGRATTGGTSLPFTVTSGSKHPDAAAAFIDFITSDDAMKVYAEKGNMPVLNTADLAPASGVGKDTYEAYSEVTTDGSLLPYLDYATPTFADALGNELQALLQSKKTPEQFGEALQKDYGDFVKKNG